MPAPPAAPARRLPPALVGAAVLAVALGVGLPRFLADAPADPAATPAGPGVGTALAKLAAAVLVGGALCAAVVRYAGRRAPAAPSAFTAAASIRLDGRCVLHYIRAGDRRLLVGTDAGGVKALVELPAAAPEPETADAPRVFYSRVATTPHGGGP